MVRTARRDYGSGSVYQRADGRWIGTLESGVEKQPDGTYRRRRKTFSGKTKADVVAKIKAAQVGGPVALQVNIPTVERWLHRWLEDIASLRLKPRTLLSYRSEVDKHIVPHLGRIRLDKLTPSHVLGWHRALRASGTARDEDKPLAESSVLKAHAVLSRALTDAVRLGLVARNVAALVDRPSSRAETQRREMSTDDALTILRSVEDDPLGSRWAAALMLGARQGELLGLTWDRTDLTLGRVELSWQLQRLPYVHGCGGKCGKRFAGDCPARTFQVAPDTEWRQVSGALCLTRPKANRPRAIPMPPQLLAWLRRHRDESPGGEFVWSRLDGRPIDPRADHDAWKAVLHRAGFPDSTLHAARHTTASLLLRLGVTEPVIMEILGHSVIATTRGYAHVDDTLARAAMDLVGEALELDA